jgi:hypothetical protein
MSDKLKEFAWSSITTFLATFFTTAVAVLQTTPVDSALSWGFWVALVMTCTRAAVKAALQYLMSGSVGEMLGAKNRV